MQVYGQLQNAALEVLSSDPSSTVQGRVWLNSTSTKLMLDDGTIKRAMLRNDQNCVLGSSGTAASNIRLNRAAAAVLQFVIGSDTTAEGSLSTSPAQISACQENYATVSAPAAGNKGRLYFDTTLGYLLVDNGATWNSVGIANPMTTGGDIIYGGASGLPTRLGNGSAGQVLTSNGTTTAPGWAAAAGAWDQARMLQNTALSTSVAASALTINLLGKNGSNPSGSNAVIIGFRSATLATGTYSTISQQAALNIVIPSGATLGLQSNMNQGIFLYAIDDAGTMDLGVAGSYISDATTQTCTQISSGSTSSTVIYSGSAHSGAMSVTFIGRLVVNETTIGTWSAAATEIDVGWVPVLTTTQWSANAANVVHSLGEYTMTISSATIVQGDTYTNNGQTFLVTTASGTVTSMGTIGSGAPAASGTLTRASGTGPATLTFSAVTTNLPTKPGSPRVDTYSYRRIGSKLFWRYYYAQGSAGATQGPGIYVMPIPGGNLADLTKVTASTGTATSTQLGMGQRVGWGTLIVDGSYSAETQPELYNSGYVKFRYIPDAAAGSSFWGTGTGAFTATNVGWTGEIEIDILGWQDYGP